MGVRHESYFPNDQSQVRLECQQCGMGDSYDPQMKDHLWTAVWWDFLNGPTIVLCPPCAEHIGTQLIADAARACVSLNAGKMGMMRREKNKALRENNQRCLEESRRSREEADPSLVTKRPSHDDEDELL